MNRVRFWYMGLQRKLRAQAGSCSHGIAMGTGYLLAILHACQYCWLSNQCQGSGTGWVNSFLQKNLDSKHISAVFPDDLPCPFFRINTSSRHFLIRNLTSFNLIHSREIVSPFPLLDSVLRNCGAAPTHILPAYGNLLLTFGQDTALWCNHDIQLVHSILTKMNWHFCLAGWSSPRAAHYDIHFLCVKVYHIWGWQQKQNTGGSEWQIACSHQLSQAPAQDTLANAFLWMLIWDW